MRRALIPLVLLVVAAVSAWQMRRADDAADNPPEPAGQIAEASTTPVLSARRVPEFVQTPASDELLASDLADITALAPPSTCLVVREGGRIIFEHNPDLALIPASNQKLLAAAAAYEDLGADYRFTTEVRSAAPPDNGVIDGDVWFVGGGDPVLDTDPYAARFEVPEPNTDIEALADQIVASGVTRITGGIIGDESRYDTQRYNPSWPDRFTNLNQNQTGPLSALMVDEGFLPPYPDDPTNRPAATAAAEPAIRAADLLQILLALRGVTVDGPSSLGTAPPEAATVLGTIESPPLSDVITFLLADSDNTTAELLVKELGYQDTGLGTTQSGAASMIESLRRLDVATGGLVVDDGSGLSTLNRVSCNQLADVLESAGPASDLADGLAVAGETGMLQPRFLDTDLVGRLRGKTGSLNDVRSLAGFAEAADDDVLTFALIANEEQIANNGFAVALQQAIGSELITYPDGPPLEALSPQ